MSQSTSDRPQVGRVPQLVEHVELREAGWWEEAIRRTLLSELWEKPAGLSARALVVQVLNVLNAPDDTHLAHSLLDGLLESEQVFESKGTLYLSEAARLDLTQQKNSSSALDVACAERYRSAFSSHGLIPHSWEFFKTSLIFPLTRELGAQTLGLLRGDASLMDTTASRQYLDTFPNDARDAIQAAVVTFLDPSVDEVRRFILGLLNHYLLVTSSALDRKTLEKISGGEGKLRTFNVVVDTNVIFSMMDLHRNPMNDASRSLLGLVQSVEGYANIKFFVLATTLDEAIAALKGAKDHAPSGRVFANMAQAALITGHASGLLTRYFEAVSRNRELSPSSYFDPYILGLELMLAEKGITVLDEGLDALAERASVKKRIDDWYSFEFDKPDGRPRHKIKHDVIALEFVKNQRADRPVSLMDVGWWFVTVDTWLQRQEQRDNKGNKAFAKSINPAELVQLLRFWVPRSEAMERALLGAIRLPFSFFTYDPKAERSVLKILDTLSGYEDVEQVPVEVIETVLGDKALRAALEKPGGDDRAKSLVKDSFTRVAREHAGEIDRLQKENEALRQQAAQAQKASERRAKIDQGSAQSKKALLDKIARLEARARKLEARDRGKGEKDNQEVERLRKEVEGLTASSSASAAQLSTVLRVAKWATFSIVTLAVLGLLTWVFLSIKERFALGFWQSLGMAFLGLVISTAICHILVQRLDLSGSRAGKFVVRAHSNLWAWIGAGVVCIVLTFAAAPPK